MDIHLYNDIHINKNQYAGGLIGIAEENTSIKKSSVQRLNSGGFDCGSGNTCAFGGLIGLVANNQNGKVIVNQTFVTGSIYTKKNAGGLIGFIEPQANIDILNSYAIVNVSNRCNDVGDCLAKYAGGLIGRAKEDEKGSLGVIHLQQVYAAGEINVLDERGGKGIVGGDAEDPATRVIGYESYFDTNKTTQNQAGDNISIGLSAQQMHNPAYFYNWDREIWQIQQGQYPQLIHVKP